MGPPLQRMLNSFENNIRDTILALGAGLVVPGGLGPNSRVPGRTPGEGLPTLDRLDLPGSGGFFYIVFNLVILIK